jgi:UDP-N-acetylglucosamine acyltransferase
VPIDPSATIAPTARVHPDAIVGPGTHVGEFCVIEQDVVIGAGCRLEPYVFVKRWTSMGDNNEISSGTVLGTDPLDKNFTGARSYLKIGNGNKIREHFTISRATKPEGETVIGDGNYIMTSGHIAHDCRIGNNAVICSCVLVAGYVQVEDQAFISGPLGIHQYSRIGRLSMIGGLTRVNQDALPFFLYAGSRMEPKGLNLVGLKRASFDNAEIRRLKTAYTLLYRSGLRLAEALQRIEAEALSEATLHLVEFIRASHRGINRERAKVLPSVRR